MTLLQELMQGYLVAYLAWFDIALGCLAFLLIYQLTRAAWLGSAIRPIRAASATIPALAIMFIPIAIGTGMIYPWAGASGLAAPEFKPHQSHYLNQPFFIIRSVLYFALWIFFDIKSRTTRSAPISATGLIVYVITATFASIDWIMSLRPSWSSTTFGLITISRQGVAALAFTLITGSLFFRKQSQEPSNRLNMANMLLAFVMIWSYVTFMQYLIMWAGNLPQEVAWFAVRSRSGWQWLAIILLLFQFAIPFFFLLFRFVKHHALTVSLVSLIILFVRVVDLYWMIIPEFHPADFKMVWTTLVLVLVLGALWISIFVRQLKLNRSIQP